jgi:hypothetical protein
MLSEAKHGGANSSAKVFTSKIMEYVRKTRASAGGATFAEEREALSDRFKGH